MPQRPPADPLAALAPGRRRGRSSAAPRGRGRQTEPLPVSLLLRQLGRGARRRPPVPTLRRGRRGPQAERGPRQKPQREPRSSNPRLSSHRFEAARKHCVEAIPDARSGGVDGPLRGREVPPLDGGRGPHAAGGSAAPLLLGAVLRLEGRRKGRQGADRVLGGHPRGPRSSSLLASPAQEPPRPESRPRRHAAAKSEEIRGRF